ncbi:MAG: hypothetical protein ACC662_06165 [Planctomycetota bacterium]
MRIGRLPLHRLRVPWNPLVAGLALVFALATGQEVAWAGEAASRPPQTPLAPDRAAAEAIEDLSSLAETRREAALERLVELLPGSRAAVIDALSDAPFEVKEALTAVLARDGSAPAVRALLAELKRADSLLAARIRHRIALDPVTTENVLSAWRQDPSLRLGADGKVAGPTAALERLLDRVEVERLFLSRKSRSGSTGAYRGQYDVLEPHREVAVALATAILLDRALPEEGVYSTGPFAFLRPPPEHIDIGELRSMAAHAFEELARESDVRAVSELGAFLFVLRRRIVSSYASDDFDFLENVGRYADIVVALYHVQPQRYAALLEELLAKLKPMGEWWRWMTPSHRASILLQVGRYEEAIRAFQDLLRAPPFGVAPPSRAMTYYNMACAFARWGERVEGKDRQEKRIWALYYLERAIEHHWSDIGWFDEDRDLDLIRDSREFRRLRERVIEANTPPSER